MFAEGTYIQRSDLDDRRLGIETSVRHSITDRHPIRFLTLVPTCAYVLNLFILPLVKSFSTQLSMTSLSLVLWPQHTRPLRSRMYENLD